VGNGRMYRFGVKLFQALKARINIEALGDIKPQFLALYGRIKKLNQLILRPFRAKILVKHFPGLRPGLY